MVERDHPELPLKVQAELRGISYSSLFYQRVPPSPRELAIKRRIDELYTACPFYGSRKIAVLLHRNLAFRSQPCKPTHLHLAQVQVCAKWAFLPLFRVQIPANRLLNTIFTRMCCDM